MEGNRRDFARLLEFVKRNVTERSQAEVQSLVKNKALTLVNSGTEQSLHLRKEKKRQRSELDTLARRVSRKKLKKLKAEAQSALKYEDLHSLIESWRAISSATLDKVCKDSDSLSVDELSREALRKARVLKKMNLRGALVRVQFAGGRSVTRERQGVLLDVSKNSVLIVRKHGRPMRYPKVGTKLSLVDYPHVHFWCDLLV